MVQYVTFIKAASHRLFLFRLDFKGRSGESHLKCYSLIYCVSFCCDCDLRVDWVDSETQGPSTSSFIHDNFSLQHRLMKIEDVHCLRHVWMLEKWCDINISDRYQSVSDICYDALIWHHCGSFNPTAWLPLSRFWSRFHACGVMATERQGLPLSSCSCCCPSACG